MLLKLKCSGHFEASVNKVDIAIQMSVYIAAFKRKKIKETVKTNNVQSKVRRAPRTNPVQSSFTRRTEKKRAVYTMYNSVEAMRSVIYRLYSDRRHVLMVLFAKSRLHAIGMNVRRG